MTFLNELTTFAPSLKTNAFFKIQLAPPPQPCSPRREGLAEACPQLGFCEMAEISNYYVEGVLGPKRQ